MALKGMSNNSGGGGSETFVPYIKYDARSGRFFRMDRVERGGTWEGEQVPIEFRAVVDMENIEVGYIKFAASGPPALRLVRYGETMPEEPDEEGWKQAVRVMLALHKSCGGDIREISSNAGAFREGFDNLHDQWEEGMAANPGLLPIVEANDKLARPKESGRGSQRSTNYVPAFEITGWVPRPASLVFVPKAQPSAPAPWAGNLGRGVERQQPARAPVPTGSTRVGAPTSLRAVPGKPVPAWEADGESGFG
jgi:hypothetical protein